MKFLISESQFQNIANKLKPVLFKYWDSLGPSLSSSFYTFFSIDHKTRHNFEPYFQDFLVEWMGGDEKFIQFLKKDEGKTFQIVDGDYNFEIVLDKVTVNEYEVYLHVRIKPGGTVTLIFNEGELTIPLEEAISNENFGWEINSEVGEVIFNKFFKFFSEFGITMGNIDVDYM